MTEQELNAIVEAKLEAELAARLEADRARIRLEVVDQIRRAAEKAHYDKINARAPIEDQYGGIGREAHEARLKAMKLNAAADAAHMARINAAPVEGSLAYAKQRASIGPGAEGFEIRPARRS